MGAADKNDNSNLFLTILNVVSIVKLSIDKQFFKKFGEKIRLLPVFIFICFFFWSVLTIIPAINPQLSFLQLTFYFTQIMSFIFILVYIDDLKVDFKTYLQFIVVFFTIAELVPTMYNYLNDIVEYGKPFSRKLVYRGVTGNINILAFSLLIKFPLLFYFFLKSKNKIAYLALIISSFFVIIQITKTRGAILSLGLITLLILIACLFNQKNQKKYFNILGNNLAHALILIISISSIFLLDNYLEKHVFQTSSTSINRIASITNDDFSTNSRIRYYSQAIESIIQNPMLGIGVGNWEIIGVDKDSQNMDAYIVPYHVHNDYLEIAAESGIVGSILYFSMILYVLTLLLKRFIKNIKNKEDNIFNIVLGLSIVAYLLDAMFNFPSARFLQQTNLFFILSISIIHLGNDVKSLKIKFLKPIIIIILILMPFSIYSTVRSYKASSEGVKLLAYFNSRASIDLDKEFIYNIEYKYPNVGVTTIPIQAIKAIWYYNQGEIDTALVLFRDGIKYNPFIRVSDAFIGKIYLDKEMNDSALYYTEKAFRSIPNNDFHISLYYETLTRLKDSISVKEAFSIPREKTELRQRLYFEAMTQILEGEKSEFAFEDIDLPLASSNDAYMQGYYSVKVGRQQMLTAATANLLGTEFFNKQQFELALSNYEIAFKNNPYEIPYFENLANTLIQLNRNDEVLNQIEKFLISNGEISNKLRYIKALALFSLNKGNLACIEFLNLLNDEYLPQNIYNTFCN